MVRSAELNGTTAADFVGVEADGKTLIRRRDNPSTGAPEQATLLLTRTVIDLQIIKHWTTSGPPVVAVLTPGGVNIYDQDWVALQFFPAAAPGGAIAVVHEQNEPDQLAWAMEQPSAPQQLELLKSTGVRLGPVMPADVHVVAMAAGDLDGDGDDDVVLSQRHDYAPRCWKNDGFQNAVNTDAPAAITTDGMEDIGTGNHALPLVADLDLDGFADVVVAVQTTETYSVYLRQQSVTPSVLTSAEFFQLHSLFEQAPSPATSRLMELKVKWDTFPSGVSKMEVIVWRQDYTSQGPLPPQQDSINHGLFSVPGNPPQNIDGVTVTAELSVDMPDPNEVCFSSVYWFEVRAVKDNMAPASPTFFLAIVSYLQRANDIAAGGVKLELDNTNACLASPPEHPGLANEGSTRAPCGAPKRTLPSFGADVVPQILPQPPFSSWLIPDL
jgi:hypothetical protein